MNAEEALLLIVKNNMKILDQIFVNIKPHNEPQVIKKKEYDDYKVAVKQFNSLTLMNQEILNQLYPDRQRKEVTILQDKIVDFSNDAEWVKCEITAKEWFAATSSDTTKESVCFPSGWILSK